MRHRLLLPLCFIVFLLTCFSGSADAKNVALVIGNGAYQHANQLPNPKNDALAVAKALGDLGFDVVQGVDVDHRAMEDLLRDFLRKADGAEVALVFYAGHGLQVDGRNYLVPVDASLQAASDLGFSTVALDRVLAAMEHPSRANIIILDACRDNPLARSFAAKSRSGAVGAGLAAYTTVGTGTLIAFATAPDKVAADGAGSNSPFTENLVRHMKTPGLEVRQMLTRVRLDVVRATDNRQIPWDNSSLLGEVYLAGRPAASPLADRSEDAWSKIEGSNDAAAFKFFLRIFPNSKFAALATRRFEELSKVAPPPAPPLDAADAAKLTDRGLIQELQTRLYELNYDPDPATGVVGVLTVEAVKTFQGDINRPADGVPTLGLLKRLRAAGDLKPWGSIAYDERSGSWGMTWNKPSRAAAAAAARETCGGAKCRTTLSFFGGWCGAFAYAPNGWALSSRDSIAGAREEAMKRCSALDKTCGLIAVVCADGSNKFVAAK